MQPMHRKKQAGQTLRRAFPIARYLAVLLISLNILRLPANTWLLPEITGSRRFLMGWAALLLLLDRPAVGKYRRMSSEDSLSFLALAVPGFFLLDAAGIAHLYLSWFYSGRSITADASGTEIILLMAAGCVLWIYGSALPALPYGSIWGIRTKATIAAEAEWKKVHKQAAVPVSALGVVCLIIGTVLL